MHLISFGVMDTKTGEMHCIYTESLQNWWEKVIKSPGAGGDEGHRGGGNVY